MGLDGGLDRGGVGVGRGSVSVQTGMTMCMARGGGEGGAMWVAERKAGSAAQAGGRRDWSGVCLCKARQERGIVHYIYHQCSYGRVACLQLQLQQTLPFGCCRRVSAGGLVRQLFMAVAAGHTHIYIYIYCVQCCAA